MKKAINFFVNLPFEEKIKERYENDMTPSNITYKETQITYLIFKIFKPIFFICKLSVILSIFNILICVISGII